MELGRKALLIFFFLCLNISIPSFLYGKAHAGSVAVVSATVTVIKPEEDLSNKSLQNIRDIKSVFRKFLDYLMGYGK